MEETPTTEIGEIIAYRDCCGMPHRNGEGDQCSWCGTWA